VAFQRCQLILAAELADESVEGGCEEQTEAGDADHAEQHGRAERSPHFGAGSRRHRERVRANQLRLWLASLAYILLCAVRRIGLHHTAFSNVSCGTIRLKLLKIGAHRIKFAMTSSCPVAAVWGRAATLLNAAASARGSPA
jgi:hypothetical protein